MEYLYKMYSVDIDDILYERGFKHSNQLQLLLDNIDGWGIGKAESFAELLGLKCWSENTYNSPDTNLHLKNDVQYHIISGESDEPYYDDNAIILIEPHLGGDPRGNYGNMIVYKCGKHSSPEDLICGLYVDSEDVEPYEEYEKRMKSEVV